MNKITLLPVWVGICLSIMAVSASAQVDSLRSVIKKHQANGEDSLRIHAQSRLARHLMFFEDELDEGLEIVEQSLKEAQEKGFPFLTAKIRYMKGYALINFRTNFKGGLSEYFKALEFFEKDGDYNDLSGLLMNIGNALHLYQSYDEAIKYSQLGRQVAMEAGKPIDVASFESNIAASYDASGRKEKAREYYKKALKVYQENELYIEGLETRFNIASIVMDSESPTTAEIEEAVATYKESIPIFDEAGADERLMIAMKNAGAGLTELGRYREALDYLEPGLDLAIEKNNYIMISTMYKSLAMAHHGLGQYEQESRYLHRHLDVHDTLFNIAKADAVADVRAKYEAEKKERENRILRQHDKIQKLTITNQDAELAQERTMRYALFGGIGLIAIFSIFIFNRFRVTMRQKKIIENQKEQVDQAYEQLGVKNKEILDSIEYAKRLQEAILPPPKLVKEYLPDSFILYKPKDIVAGDFYFMESVDGYTYYAAADCTGHGVPGAMVSVVCSNALNKAILEEGLRDSGKVLTRVKQLVIERFDRSEETVYDGMDIALVRMEAKDDHYEFCFSGANNPMWLIRKGAAEVEEYRGDSMPIGRFAIDEEFKSETVRLNKGDSAYVFSDGYVDQFGGERGKKLKSRNFKKLLLDIRDLPMDEQYTRLNNSFEAWRGDLEQIDDVCVIGVRL